MPVFLQALLRDSDYLERAGLPPVESLDLLQQSAVFWHCQRHFFQCIQCPSGIRQLLPVSMETFLIRPLDTLLSINEFLQLGMSEALLTEVVQRGAFRQHSKTGAGYGPEQQHLEAQAIAQRHDAEIRRTLKWAAPLLRAMPVEPFSDDEEGFA